MFWQILKQLFRSVSVSSEKYSPHRFATNLSIILTNSFIVNLKFQPCDITGYSIFRYQIQCSVFRVSQMAQAETVSWRYEHNFSAIVMKFNQIFSDDSWYKRLVHFCFVKILCNFPRHTTREISSNLIRTIPCHHSGANHLIFQGGLFCEQEFFVFMSHSV